MDVIYSTSLVEFTNETERIRFRRHPGQIGEYHHHAHEEYVPQHDQYPTIQHLSDGLGKRKQIVNFYCTYSLKIFQQNAANLNKCVCVWGGGRGREGRGRGKGKKLMGNCEEGDKSDQGLRGGILINGSQLAKIKSRFLTCPCHKIYRDEAVGLKGCNYTY